LASFIFDKEAFGQFSEWALEDKKIFQKITELLQETRRSPFTGKGKPEPLKHQLAGYWSRRITDEHRLVYKMDGNGNVVIISCKDHYSRN